MLTKRELLIFVFLMFGLLLSAATVAEVYAAKDVVACRYYDKLGLIDLATGNEATILTDNDDNAEIIDFAWDKQSKNLYVLESVYIPGPDYDSPGRSEVRLTLLNLPSCSKTPLKTIKVTRPQGYGEYSYPTLNLDKNANPVITLFFGTKNTKYQQYTYNCTAKTLSTPTPKLFNNYLEGYKRQHQPLITTEKGKYWNEEYWGLYSLNTVKGDRAITITNPKNLKYSSSIISEPMRYCIAPDSTYILFGYRWDEELSLGCTYLMNAESFECTLLSDKDCLGDSFAPAWLSNGTLVFLEKADYYSGIKKPSLKLVESATKIKVLKEWESETVGPLAIQYRVR